MRNRVRASLRDVRERTQGLSTFNSKGTNWLSCDQKQFALSRSVRLLGPQNARSTHSEAAPPWDQLGPNCATKRTECPTVDRGRIWRLDASVGDPPVAGIQSSIPIATTGATP